jgi:hypothetical protein
MQQLQYNKIIIHYLNSKGLAQVVRVLVLVLVASPSSLKFESHWVQAIPWDHARRRSQSLIRFVWKGCFAQVRNLPDKGEYTK